jgi:phosphate transport system substrate-binding protein
MRARRRYSFAILALAAALLAVLVAGCGGDDETAEPATPPAEPAEPAEPPAEPAEPPAEPAETSEAPAEEPAADLSGNIEVDGSSTVGPLIQAAAEFFQEENSGVNVTVGISGTGGGFERFCVGETDISNASRPIDPEDEAEGVACEANGIDYVELQVAIDALTVVTNTENDWASCLTVEQLNTMWAPEAEGTVTNWNQVDPSFPDQELVLSGPGTDSGTFDYFTDAVNGEEGASRADYNASEDDNVIVQAVAGDPGGLGYFGFTYYEENQDTLNAVEIDGGSGCVAPSPESAQDGSYTPLARPLFIYVKTEALAKPEVAAFAQYILDNNATIAEAALFIPLSDDQLAASQEALAGAVGG